jgi:hypothetical protein
MRHYLVTAWCDRPFYAECEVEAETPQQALEMARAAIHDAPAEECDQGYYWDEWRVDTEEADGILLHLGESARLRGAAAGLLAFAARIARMTQDGEEVDGKEFVMENDDAVDTLNALIDEARHLVAEATGRAA